MAKLCRHECGVTVPGISYNLQTCICQYTQLYI